MSRSIPRAVLVALFLSLACLGASADELRALKFLKGGKEVGRLTLDELTAKAQPQKLEVFEFQNGEKRTYEVISFNAVMDADKTEHVAEFVRVLERYCVAIGVRTFAALKNWEEERTDPVLNAELAHARGRDPSVVAGDVLRFDVPGNLTLVGHGDEARVARVSR